MCVCACVRVCMCACVHVCVCDAVLHRSSSAVQSNLAIKVVGVAEKRRPANHKHTENTGARECMVGILRTDTDAETETQAHTYSRTH